MRVIVRGYANGKLLFEEQADVDDEDLEALAARHGEALAPYEDMMVEFEFPDMPESDRFLRFGTDPRLMVQPIAVDLTKLAGGRGRRKS